MTKLINFVVQGVLDVDCDCWTREEMKESRGIKPGFIEFFQIWLNY